MSDNTETSSLIHGQLRPWPGVKWNGEERRGEERRGEEWSSGYRKTERFSFSLKGIGADFVGSLFY